MVRLPKIRREAKHPLVSKVPRSKMVKPGTRKELIKYYFWRAYTPLHPTVRNSAVALKLFKYTGRQPFLLGKIAPHLTPEQFVIYLVEQGFAYFPIGWVDPGEIVSLRKVDNFKYQYHIRIYDDGEVRGHYELTPEAHPIRHLNGKGQTNSFDDFKKILGERLEWGTPDAPGDSGWVFRLNARRHAKKK